MTACENLIGRFAERILELRLKRRGAAALHRLFVQRLGGGGSGFDHALQLVVGIDGCPEAGVESRLGCALINGSGRRAIFDASQDRLRIWLRPGRVVSTILDILSSAAFCLPSAKDFMIAVGFPPFEAMPCASVVMSWCTSAHVASGPSFANAFRGSLRCPAHIAEHPSDSRPRRSRAVEVVVGACSDKAPGEPFLQRDQRRRQVRRRDRPFSRFCQTQPFR